jgi:cytochrome P450
LFLAGAETTSTTLQWAMLYMLAFPEVQRKVQAEIDAVIGSNRTPSLDDKSRFIYLSIS